MLYYEDLWAREVTVFINVMKTLKGSGLRVNECERVLEACINSMLKYINAKDFQIPESSEEES